MCTSLTSAHKHDRWILCLFFFSIVTHIFFSLMCCIFYDCYVMEIPEITRNIITSIYCGSVLKNTMVSVYDQFDAQTQIQHQNRFNAICFRGDTASKRWVTKTQTQILVYKNIVSCHSHSLLYCTHKTLALASASSTFAYMRCVFMFIYIIWYLGRNIWQTDLYSWGNTTDTHLVYNRQLWELEKAK